MQEFFYLQKFQHRYTMIQDLRKKIYGFALHMTFLKIIINF